MTSLNRLEDSALAQVLGISGMDELRSKLIDMIVEECREQLRISSEYIINPDNISADLYDDIIEEVKREVRNEYMEQIKKKMESILN